MTATISIGRCNPQFMGLYQDNRQVVEEAEAAMKELRQMLPKAEKVYDICPKS